MKKALDKHFTIIPQIREDYKDYVVAAGTYGEGRLRFGNLGYRMVDLRQGETILRKGNDFFVYGTGDGGSDYAFEGSDGEVLIEITRDEAIAIVEAWNRGTGYYKAEMYADRVIEGIKLDLYSDEYEAWIQEGIKAIKGVKLA